MPEIDRLLETTEGVTAPGAAPGAFGSVAPGGGRRGASPRRRPVAHPTAGDGRRAAPDRLRSSGPRPPAPAARSCTPGTMRTPVLSAERASGVAGRRNARLRPRRPRAPSSSRSRTARRLSSGSGPMPRCSKPRSRFETAGADALGWSATRWRPVLADIERLHDAIVRSDSTAAAARIDVDWRAIEALMRILDDVPAPSP